MAKELTDRQREVFEYICESIREDSRPPTVREISDHFGFRSPKAASDHLAALERKEYIVRKASSARNIQVRPELSPMGMPLVENVPGEGPVLEAENIKTALTIPELFETSDRSFALSADDDSMQGAGIAENDYVVVEEDGEIADDSVAVVLADGQTMIRRVSFGQNGHVTLIPENPDYEEQTVSRNSDGVRLVGPVSGVVRKF